MTSIELRQIRVLLRVLERRSFARAAVDVGLSAPATSQSVQALEARLGVQLVRRTTRRVEPTAAGERLAARLAPLVAELDATLEEAAGASQGVRGTLRLSVPRTAVKQWVAPWLAPFAEKYPDILVEISVDDAIVDLIAKRFDAGIRLGERLGPDMIAVPLGGPMQLAAVASPSYFARYGKPHKPRDLARHRCINQRMPTFGNLYRWEFERAGRATTLAVGGGWPGTDEGGLIVNDVELSIDAALTGAGITFVFEHLVADHLREGRLVRVLEPWCPPFPGLHLYYPRRERTSRPLRAFVDFIKSREQKPR